MSSWQSISLSPSTAAVPSPLWRGIRERGDRDLRFWSPPSLPSAQEEGDEQLSHP